jgi:hypothetical protein
VTEPDAVDLIHLEDADGDHCIVRVTGRFSSKEVSHFAGPVDEIGG